MSALGRKTNFYDENTCLSIESTKQVISKDKSILSSDSE
jgi:hypothetical protein